MIASAFFAKEKIKSTTKIPTEKYSIVFLNFCIFSLMRLLRLLRKLMKCPRPAWLLMWKYQLQELRLCCLLLPHLLH